MNDIYTYIYIYMCVCVYMYISFVDDWVEQHRIKTRVRAPAAAAPSRRGAMRLLAISLTKIEPYFVVNFFFSCSSKYICVQCFELNEAHRAYFQIFSNGGEWRQKFDVFRSSLGTVLVISNSSTISAP